jgi:nicotinamidase-related amidase
MRHHTKKEENMEKKSFRERCSRLIRDRSGVVTPAQAGVQVWRKIWFPVFTGMTRKATKGASVGLFVIGLFLCLAVVTASAQTIVDEWATVKPPKPPALKPVKIEDPKTTAFLVLDITRQICNNERRPRCVASVPRIQASLKQARAKGLTVVFSKTPGTANADIHAEVAPLEGEPVVTARADKFFKTDLEKILQDKGIKTVIVVGSAAEGAVLFTGTEAAKRGFKVIVPVDGMSSGNTYAEQYTAWHLVNNPSFGSEATLTRFDMIQF